MAALWDKGTLTGGVHVSIAREDNRCRNRFVSGDKSVDGYMLAVAWVWLSQKRSTVYIGQSLLVGSLAPRRKKFGHKFTKEARLQERPRTVPADDMLG